VSSYLGRHARLYDVFYADKPYHDEAAFMDRHFRRLSSNRPGDLLEVACGTGRHALAFEQLGYRVVAGDYSVDMLDVARARAANAGSRVQFHALDMCTLTFDGGFDFAVCLFDSIGYVRSDENVRSALRGLHSALRAGGILGFEFWHAPPMLKSFDPVRVRRFVTSDTRVLRISETALDPAARTCTVSYDIYEFFTGGRYANTQETQTNRFFDMEEMAAFLRASSFTPLHFYAGFTDNEAVDASVWHVVAFARKQ
jgi:SAM-dependent methyltransferase